jgi:hypothetical protein
VPLAQVLTLLPLQASCPEEHSSVQFATQVPLLQTWLVPQLFTLPQ